MTQLNSADVLRILDEHKKFFETGKTKNIDFRIQQLRKLRQVITSQ